MDLVDHFVRDGVFGNHRHRHFFSKGEATAEREAWLRDIEKTCKKAGVAYVVREVRKDNGRPGYEFGFADRSAYAAFVFNVFGDLEQPGGHIQHYKFGTETPAQREAFFMAAEMHLAALGIKHHWRAQNGELQFAFDRFSDRMVFESLIENGSIEASAHGLAQARALRQQLGFDVSLPIADAPRFEPG